MEINDPIVEKEVIEYEFLAVSGLRIPVIVDLEAGDTVTQEGDLVRIDLVEKPNIVDPEEILAAETVTIHRHNVIATFMRKIKRRVPTAEEVFNMKETIHKLAKTIQ